MSVISKLKVWIGSDTSHLDKGLKKSKKSVSKFEQGVGKLGKTIAAAFAVEKVVAFGREAVNLAKVQADAEKKLEAAVKSTGMAAGLSADEIKRYASELQGVTTIGDEVTIANAAILTSFTNIKRDVFKQVLASAQDISLRLDQGMKESIMKLGKALDDPIRGLGELREIGIGFTVEQTKKVKELVEAGKREEAQWLILTEVQKRYGGTAREAASDAYGAMTQLSNAWGDFKEAVGDAVTPSKEGINFLTEAVNANTQLLADKTIPTWKKWVSYLLPFYNRKLKTEAALNAQRDKDNQDMIASMHLQELNLSQLLEEEGYLFRLGGEKRKYYQEVWDAIQKEKKLRVSGVAAVTAEERARKEAEEAARKAAEERKKTLETTKMMEEDTLDALGEKIKAFETLKNSVDLQDQASLDYFNKELRRLKILQEETMKLSDARLLDAAHKRDGGVVESKHFDAEPLANTGIEGIFPDHLDSLKNETEKEEKVVLDMTSTVKGALDEMTAGFAASIGQLVSGEGSIAAFGKVVGGTFADMAIAVGKTAIQTGTAVLGIQAALKLHPFLAIAAGAALVALGTAVKAKLGNIGAGGDTTGGSIYGGQMRSAAVGTGSYVGGNIDNGPREIVVRGQLEAKGSSLIAVIDSENNRRSYVR